MTTSGDDVISVARIVRGNLKAQVLCGKTTERTKERGKTTIVPSIDAFDAKFSSNSSTAALHQRSNRRITLQALHKSSSISEQKGRDDRNESVLRGQSVRIRRSVWPSKHRDSIVTAVSTVASGVGVGDNSACGPSAVAERRL